MRLYGFTLLFETDQRRSRNKLSACPNLSLWVRICMFVVDDDPIVVRALERMLRLNDISVETFTAPTAFLERPPYDGIGCLLLDLKMPGLSGPDVQRAMSGQGMSMPIVFSARRATAHRRQRGRCERERLTSSRSHSMRHKCWRPLTGRVSRRLHNVSSTIVSVMPRKGWRGSPSANGKFAISLRLECSISRLLTSSE